MVKYVFCKLHAKKKEKTNHFIPLAKQPIYPSQYASTVELLSSFRLFVCPVAVIPVIPVAMNEPLYHFFFWDALLHEEIYPEVV